MRVRILMAALAAGAVFCLPLSQQNPIPRWWSVENSSPDRRMRPIATRPRFSRTKGRRSMQASPVGASGRDEAAGNPKGRAGSG